MKRGGVHPLRLLFGPIFQMEVRTAGRRRSTYVFRALVGGLILFFFSIVLLSTWTSLDYSQSGFARVQQSQNLAPTLASFIIWTQYIALILLAPIITGPALVEERRNQTIGALLTTPLTAWEIVLGKLTGRLTQALILAMVSVPMIFASRLLGGLSVQGIVIVVIISLVSLFMCSALSMLFSAKSSTTISAASAGFSAFLLFNFGPLLLGLLYNAWISRWVAALPDIPNSFIFSTSLPIALGAVIFENFAGEPTGLNAWQAWGNAVVYGSVVTIAAITLTGMRLRRDMHKNPDALSSPLRSTSKPKLRKLRRNSGTTKPEAGLVVDSAAETGSSRVVSDQPVLWRELRIGAIRNRRRAIWMTVILLIVFLLLYFNGGMDHEETHIVITLVGTGLFCMQAVFVASGAIAHERSAQTLDVLMTTPLAPRAILIGKFLGAMRRLWVVPAILCTHFLFAILAGAFSPVVIPLLLLLLIPAAIMLISTGLLFSVLLRKATGAAVVNLFYALTIYAGLPMIAGMTQSLFNIWENWFEKLFSAIVSFNPVVMSAVTVVGTGTLQMFNPRGDSTLEFDMPSGTMNIGSFVVTLGISGVVQLAVAFIALSIATRVLPARVGRPS